MFIHSHFVLGNINIELTASEGRVNLNIHHTIQHAHIKSDTKVQEAWICSSWQKYGKHFIGLMDIQGLNSIPTLQSGIIIIL